MTLTPQQLRLKSELEVMAEQIGMTNEERTAAALIAQALVDHATSAANESALISTAFGIKVRARILATGALAFALKTLDDLAPKEGSEKRES